MPYEWYRKVLLRLLDVRSHFREGFRIVSANTAAASANASSKNLFPRASAAPFLSYFFAISFPRTERELPSKHVGIENMLILNSFEFRYEWMIYVEVAGLCHTHSFLDRLPHGQNSFSEDDAKGEEAEAGESDSAES